MSFAIVVIINKAFKLFKLVSVAIGDIQRTQGTRKTCIMPKTCIMSIPYVSTILIPLTQTNTVSRIYSIDQTRQRSWTLAGEMRNYKIDGVVWSNIYSQGCMWVMRNYSDFNDGGEHYS